MKNGLTLDQINFIVKEMENIANSKDRTAAEKLEAIGIIKYLREKQYI